MHQKDYLSFIATNFKGSKKPHIENGAFSIWICNPKLKHGYKLFFEKYGVASEFRHALPDNQNPQLLLKSKLKTYFKFCNNLFNLDLSPKPIRIFEYKSVYGIKFKNIPPITSDKLWEDRYNTLFPLYR